MHSDRIGVHCLLYMKQHWCRMEVTMFEEKESMWKKKGFYLSLCTAMICLLAIGTVYYQMNRTPDDGADLLADTPATAEPEVSSQAADSHGIISNQSGTETKEDSSQSNTEDTSGETVAASNSLDKKKNTAAKKKEKKSTVTPTPAGKKDTTEKAKSTMASGTEEKYAFNEESGLLWPVQGKVILKYSMSNTIYFKTLAQYKCNPAIAIAAEQGTEVKAAADGVVTSVKKDDETGLTLTTNIGSNYTVSYGQLEQVSLKKGDEVKEGDVIGHIAEPTRYYAEEGSNLYFQIREKGETVDPLLLLR